MRAKLVPLACIVFALAMGAIPFFASTPKRIPLHNQETEIVLDLNSMTLLKPVPFEPVRRAPGLFRLKRIPYRSIQGFPDRA